MKKAQRIIVIALAVLVLTNLSRAEQMILRYDITGDRPQTELIKSTDREVQFEVRLPVIEKLEGTLEGQKWDRLEIPGGGYGVDVGAPEVPTFSRLVAIPATAGLRVEFEALETETLTGMHLMPAQNDAPEDLVDLKKTIRYDNAVYSQDAFYPEIQVVASAPAIMHGVRLVSVTAHPVRCNPVTGEVKIVHRFRVTVHFEGNDERNVPQLPLRPMSRSWANLMHSEIINFDDLDVEIVPVGDYLIVCEDDANLVNNLLQPLIDWKTRKGHTVHVETFSPGSSNNTIKSIIQDYYNTAEIPPEYVLLVGDTDGSYALPGWSVGWWPSYQIDHPYSQLEGGDILADVSLGRIPADDGYEVQVMGNKVLYYEKMPYTQNTDWYHQGCLIAGNSGSGISTVQLNRWIKTRMVENQFTRIDTFWYWMGGSVYGTTTSAINDGISCYNYRGEYQMENFDVNDINNLTNYFMLPFVVTITCDTGGFSGGWAGPESFMERFANVGTPIMPIGAIASVGTATIDTHTRQNNTIAYGIWSGIFEDELYQAGNALNRGKLELYNTFEVHDPSSVTNFSKYAALAGDPGVEIYNQALQYMTCDIPATLSWGENTLSLTVNQTGAGPLADALVCYWKDGDIHEVGLTNANGEITMPLNVTNPGNVKVTITKHNFYPIVDSLNVIQADVAVGYFDHQIDDDDNGSSSGDGDGIINPNETVEIPLTFKNFGNALTATGVSVTASVNDPYATLNDDYETFPDLTAGATGNSYDDLDLVVAPDCPQDYVVHLDFTTNSNQGSWNGGLDLTVISYDMRINSAYVNGGDTVLTAGSTDDFILSVTNIGEKSASSLTAVLTSLSPYVTVNDGAASFGTVSIGANATCSGDPFNLTADANTPPGYRVDLTVEYSSSLGAVQHDTISIAVGEKSSTDPQGPDDYGYYCFDNTDVNYAQAPVYDWVEIDPAHGGSGTQLSISDPSENQDESVDVQMPFTFRYYGDDINSITVCSNGWLATHADESYTDFRNYPIPSPIGPDGMIAPFWDDLITWSSGHVFKYYDSANHRFIIEWSHMKNYNSGGYQPEETFEVMLLDPAHYPTPTGDGEIIFQYNHIEEINGPGDDVPYSTVGIETPDQRDGIQIVYWNTYDDPAAAHLEDGRAYRFTTGFDYNPGNPGMVIDLTYQSGSPVPSGGGNLYFDVYVENASGGSLDFDAWLDISFEGGSPTTVVQRSFTNYQAGWTINRPNMYFPVPSSYSAGNYTLTGRVGSHPSVVWVEDGFPFSKSGIRQSDFQIFVPDGVPDPFSEIDTGFEADLLPEKYQVLGSYPNPFNPTTTIAYALPEAGRVSLKVYDIAGRLVGTLVDAWRAAGRHEVTFDAGKLSSGIYIYRLQVADFETTGKLVLMK